MGNQSIYTLLSHISAASILIPITGCVLKFKALNVILRALFLYLIISFFNELSGFILVTKGTGSYVIRNLYTLLECSFVVYMYYRIFEERIVRSRIKFFYLLFLILAVFMFIVLKRYDLEDSVVSTYESLFVLILGNVYLFKLMKELNITDLKQHYFFWLNFGFALYFSMAFILFLFYAYLEKLPLPFFQFLWGLHLLTNITGNILISIGIWKVQDK